MDAPESMSQSFSLSLFSHSHSWETGRTDVITIYGDIII